MVDKDKDKEHLLARRNCLAHDYHTERLIIMCLSLQSSGLERHACTAHYKTQLHTQLQNVHVEQLNKALKFLSDPAYCISVMS